MQRSRQHAADDTTGLPRSEPPRPREPRGPLPLRDAADFPDAGGMTHEQLVSALRAVDGLVTVAHDPPNLHYRSRPFLHFHQAEGRTYADVRFGSGDFEPVWASTPSERAALLARVCDHIEELERARKSTRRRSDERRRRRGDRD